MSLSPSSMLDFPQIDRQAHQSRISFFHCLSVSFSCVYVVVLICLSSKRDGRENERLDFVNWKEMTERGETGISATKNDIKREKREMMTKVII